MLIAEILSIKSGGEAGKLVWPLCCILMYFGGGKLVYIYKGVAKDMPKVAPGTAVKGHILWG